MSDSSTHDHDHSTTSKDDAPVRDIEDDIADGVNALPGDPAGDPELDPDLGVRD